MSDNTLAVYATIVGLVINGIGLAFVAIQVETLNYPPGKPHE
jgi:hypothetical protein